MAQRLSDCMSSIEIFKNQMVICNLEGVICDTDPKCDEKLFNHPDVLNAFNPKKALFSLANNHTYDYPNLIELTEKELESRKFFFNGVMKNGLITPTEFEISDKKYAVFTHCWKVYTETNPNTQNDIRIVDMKYKDFFVLFTEYIRSHLDTRVICYFHWNYDLETLPFPMYRQLARDLIDEGAYAIIGNHSHVPQGGESYKGRPIVYGLGNFFIPSGHFFNEHLNYPDESKKMMILEIPEDDSPVRCHWFLTDMKNPVEFICTEDFETGRMIATYSPYRNMDSAEFLRYFKRNRKKRVLVPVFKSYRGVFANSKEIAAISRIKLIKRIKG